MKLLKSIRASAKRFMHSLNEKNSSLYSLSTGVLSIISIYLLDILVRGAAPWTTNFSVKGWLITANIMLVLLLLLALSSVFFGVVGIRRAMKGNRLWMIAAVLGLLLGILPLLVSGILRSMWFKILYF